MADEDGYRLEPNLYDAWAQKEQLVLREIELFLLRRSGINIAEEAKIKP